MELQGAEEQLRFPVPLITVSMELWEVQELPHLPGLLQVSHPPHHMLQPWAPGELQDLP